MAAFIVMSYKNMYNPTIIMNRFGVQKQFACIDAKSISTKRDNAIDKNDKRKWLGYCFRR